MIDVSIARYKNEVREYYDRTNELYLRYLGNTYQAGVVVIEDSESDLYRATNLYCATQAGIQSGNHVLDAGCGSCGPAIDIAQSITDVEIDAITLSPVEAHSAQRRIQASGLTGRVRVQVADFHNLPFPSEAFDVVYFLESTGYSYDPHRLFQEAFRVLRPGGALYIKDVFVKPSPLDEQEQRALVEFDHAYAQKTQTLKSTLQCIIDVGFQQIQSLDLSDRISTKEFTRAKYQYVSIFPVLTEFGKAHQYSYDAKPFPTYFVEIKATKNRIGK